MSKPKPTKGQAVKSPPPAITRVVPAEAAVTRAFAPNKQKAGTTRAVTFNKQEANTTYSIAPKKQNATATHAVTPKEGTIASLPFAGFFTSKLAPSKEEMTLPLLAAPPGRGSGTFSLFGAGPKKAVSKQIASRRP